MAKGGRPGGGGGGRISATSAMRALKGKSDGFASGNAPEKLTINGVELKRERSSTYESNGGFNVHTYKYVADRAISREGEHAVSFNATNYKTASGKKVSGYERRKSRIFNVKIEGGKSPYSSGSSGGIGRR